ncbi:MAG TPA: divalent-cation tolerance protein CutA [Blastocatellia bacterium]|nr:divalent-cation tolerance protein CutA [Blastocatellia bacterium]
MTQELVVLVTTPGNELAERIADALVQERLAACVNIVGQIKSIYRWEGEITRDSESLMLIKTTGARYSELESRIRELHTYSNPEIIALRIEQGATAYLNWVVDSTQ